MLQALNANESTPGLFNNHSELFSHIVEVENLKLLEDHPQFGQTEWSFVVFSPKNVAMLYQNMERCLISQTLKEAYENELSLIEICTGDYANPTQIPLTPDVDLDGLKKAWSLKYCKAHKNGWTVRN